MPPSRSPTSEPSILPMKLLREVPTTIGRPSSAQLAEPSQQLQVVLEGLAEADPRVEPDPLLGDARRDRDLDPLGEERSDLVDDVLVGRVDLHRPRVPLHVHQDQAGAAVGAEPGDLRRRPAAR